MEGRRCVVGYCCLGDVWSDGTDWGVSFSASLMVLADTRRD